MGFAKAWYINQFRRYLETLEVEWQRYAEKKQSSGVMERTLGLFQPKYDYDQLSPSLSNSLNQLRRDWCFLQTFVESICRCDAAEEIQSLIQKLHTVVGEIRTDIFCTASKHHYYFKRPHELLSLLSECQRKTDELCNSEIRNALDELSNSTFHKLSDDYFFWGLFFPCVLENLRSIKDADHGDTSKQVGFLLSELEWIQRYLKRGRRRSVAKEILDFCTLVVRIGIQSCNFWFNRAEPEIVKVKATVLLDLHREIDPTNPEFLQLNLRFLEALYKSGDAVYASDCLSDFCSYLLIWMGEEDLKNELMSLVTFYFNNTLEDGEDVQSFFAEIKAVLGEAASFYRTVQREATITHPAHRKTRTELVTKVCLLKAEFFLKGQLNTSTSLMLLSDDQFFKVDMFLTNLRAFTKYLCRKQNSEYLRQSLALVEELCNEVKSLHISLQSRRITNSLIKHSLLQLLFKIVFFKAESFLTELLKSSDTLISNEKGQIGALVEELKYFKRIITNKLARETSEENLVILQVEPLVREIIFFSYSFLPDNDKFNKMISLLPLLLDKVKIVKAKLREKSEQFPMFIFPKTYGLGLIDFLGRNIRELLIYDPELIAPVKHDIEKVQLHLESFKSFLMKVDYPDVVQGELKDLGNHIMDLAFKLEYVIDLIEVDGHLQQSPWLFDLLEDIRLVDRQVSTTHEIPCVGKVQSLPQSLSQMITQDTVSEIDDIDLDEEQTLIVRLTRGSFQRDVISIVGMPGGGKTTLAKRVFNNKNVMCHFHVYAWCTITQVYLKRALLLEILSHILVLTSEIHQKTDDDLQLELRRKLLGKKYLIVMDDVWGIAAWNDLDISFPDESNGSRILITSRLRDVAFKIKPDSAPHFIRLLSVEESWVLLKKKVFESEVCPEELLQVGMEIAQHCQGLPLAVVAIAGLLRKTGKSHAWWKRISKSLSSEIINDPENRCKEILDLSYKHLPEYLKACFLYLGVFLEDRDIPVSKLIRFWIAEGFIQETESKSLEDVAEDYLLELINRSLVNISKRRSNGRVKACRLHDLLRDLCHLKAKDENFLELVTRNDKPYTSFPDSDYGIEFDDKNELTPVTFESYRLSFYLKRRHFIDSRPSGQGTRTLIFFASIDSEPKCPYDISFICHNFKLLRVLDLETVVQYSLPVEIGLMVQLRYFAVSGYMQSIPPSIANLWKLETLIVKGLRGKVILPETIWSMANLRHLHVNNHVAFRLRALDEQIGGSFCLENLVSFSTPTLSCGEDTLSILKRMPNLRKLRCIFLQSRDSSEDFNGFPVLNFLTRLESLKIIYYGGAVNPRDFILPSNLKKLTLSNFCLQQKHLSMICALLNLEVLKLLAGAFEEQTWEMKEEEFKELKFLELDTMNIAKWEASHDHLPSLEQLVLRNCRNLEAIPSDFAYIPTLQIIEVQWCGQSVEASAEEIGDATMEIQVFIRRL